MTVMPTLEGGLKLTPENEDDWQVLAAILTDAHQELATRLGGLMDEESMWDDIVVPDLETHFSSQLTEVLEALKRGKEAGEITIPLQKSEAWYGALNQARLGLETRYHFGPEERIELEEMTSEDEQNAYRRGRFYSTIQGVLLEYIMPD